MSEDLIFKDVFDSWLHEEEKLKNMLTTTSAKAIASKAIDENKNELEMLSSTIWNNPELSSKEFFAHDYLTNFLAEKGFNVSKHFPLQTSFIATFGESGGTTIGICCEYDALPDIGHACGHNLIAEASIGAALGVKEVLEKNQNTGTKVIIYGTPAEESGGGKVQMMQHKAFDESDLCIMAHPALYNLPDPIMVAVSQFKVIYRGKPSHAAAAPWDGVNALDAAVSCYNNVSMLRQQMKPTSRIHCVMLKGGDAPNIIPELSELSFFVRAVTDLEMLLLKKQVEDCAKGAGTSTGCTVEFIEGALYNALKSNRPLIDLYVNNSKSLGTLYDYTGSKQGGSTDMGNLSTIKPSIHPKFKISSQTNIHTKGFCDAVILKENQEPTLNVAKSLAMTSIDVIFNPELLEKIKIDFDK